MAEPAVRAEFSTEERAALVALSSLFVFTLLWWSFALWPTDADSFAVLQRAREVCFGRSESGLPDARGWLVLIGQPITMGTAVVVVWKSAVQGAMRGLIGRGWGQLTLVFAMVLVTVGVGMVSARVRGAIEASTFDPQGAMLAEETRLDHPVPEFVLTDQNGVLRGPQDMKGHPTLLTFAFGHCETLCPIMVEMANRVAERLRDETGLQVVVVTVDPWRDTPSRLPALVAQWNLSSSDLVLSGSVDQVQAALEAFGIGISRDLRTGDITHPGRIFIIDAEAMMRYSVPADPAKIEQLIRAGL